MILFLLVVLHLYNVYYLVWFIQDNMIIPHCIVVVRARTRSNMTKNAHLFPLLTFPIVESMSSEYIKTSSILDVFAIGEAIKTICMMAGTRIFQEW